MVALAAASEERLIASDLELVASGVSYTATTLRRLAAAGYERSQMFFITGADAFAEISTWKDSQDLFSLAHFVVISRPGTLVTRLAERLPALSGRMRRVDQTNANSGRHRDGDGDLSIFLIDAATPEVSSTDIRGRVQQGLAIDGLVPPAVARYIHQHELYALSRGVPAGTGRGSELA
jgi:nicotinate-nucleotide adenylyltransferase